MAGDINRVNLIGRLTRDPELKYTQGGAAVGNFSIANNRTYTTSAGEKREEVSYFDCVAWGKLGEIIVEYCRKGGRIAVEGRIQQRRWEDQNANKRSKIEIIVENFQFLDSKSNSDQSYSQGPPQEQPVEQSFQEPQQSNADISEPAANDNNNPFSDNDIPF